MSSNFKQTLTALSTAAIEQLARKDKEYGSSWCKRGGIGAFMMLARKWDRLENAVLQQGYDIFKCFELDDRPEGILDDIRDLKAYLMLVEEYLLRIKSTSTPSPIPLPASAAEGEVVNLGLQATAEAQSKTGPQPMVGDFWAHKDDPFDSATDPTQIRRIFDNLMNERPITDAEKQMLTEYIGL